MSAAEETIGRPGFEHESAAVTLAPEYTDADLETVWVGNMFSSERLLVEAVSQDLSTVEALECPLILFNGRDDYNVSSGLAAEWFDRVQAPSKTLVWFERSAHEIMNEEPGKILISLVQHARRIAENAGDTARD